MKNKLIHRFGLLSLPLLLTGCLDFDTPDNGPLIKLYEQRIPHSSLILYKFDYYGNFATLSDYTGLTILDSSVPFARDKIDRLPGDYFTAKPNPQLLKMVSMKYITGEEKESDTLLLPYDQYSERINGIQIKVKAYKPTYGTTSLTGYMGYQFDGMKETDDSLTFFNVVRLGGGIEYPSTTTLS